MGGTEAVRYCCPHSSYSTSLITDADLNLYVGQLTPKQKSDPAVQHALSVQRALAMGNYHSLFDLYLNAPNMGAYIMDHFINRERVKALIVMTKAYVLCSASPYCLLPPRPSPHLVTLDFIASVRLLAASDRYRTLPLPFIQNELTFDTVALAREFLMEHRAATFQNPNSPDDEKVLECKPAAMPLAQVFEEKYRKVQIKGAV